MKIRINSCQLSAVSYQLIIMSNIMRTIFRIIAHAQLLIIVTYLLIDSSGLSAQSRVLHGVTPSRRDTIHVNSCIDKVDLGGGREAVVFGVSNYHKFDGTWDRVNSNIYVRKNPTVDGYSMGVWTGCAIVQFPDSSNGWVVTKLRDVPLSIKQKFVGVAYLNKSTKEYTLINPPRVLRVLGTDILISGNSITYSGVYPGVNLRYIYYDGQLKSEFTISEAARNSLHSPYPDDETLIVLVTEIDHSTLVPKSKRRHSEISGLLLPSAFNEEMKIDSVGIGLYDNAIEIFRLPFGWAFLADTASQQESNPDDSRVNGQKFRMKQVHVRKNGKNFLLSGIPYNIVKNTAEFPGGLIFDPTIEWQHGADLGVDTYIDAYYNERNFGVRTSIRIRAQQPSGEDLCSMRGLIFFDSLKYYVPENSLLSAKLIFTTISYTSNHDDTLRIHPVARVWTEGDKDNAAGIANWDSASTSADNGGTADSAWTNSGGDFYDSIFIERFIAQSGYSGGDTIIFNVTDLVAGVIDSGWVDYGWLIKYRTDDDGTNNNLSLYSSDHGTASYRPKLIVEYLNLYLYKPYDAQIRALSDSSFEVSAKDTSISRKGFFVYRKGGAILDTVIVPGDGSEFTFLDTLFGYNPNIPDSFKIATFDSSYYEQIMDGFLLAHTLSRKPQFVVVDTTDTTMHITRCEDGNPSNVLYALYDIYTGLYVDSSGISHSEIFWSTQSSFDDTIGLPFITPNAEFKLVPYALNNDSVITGGDTTIVWSWAQIPDVVSAYPHSKDSVLIKVDPKANPAYTFFAIEDSVSGLFVDFAAHTLRSQGVTPDSTWAWATYSELGGAEGYYLIVEPNTTYVFRAYSKEGKIRDP